ncbi:hypothetical protein C1N91_00505 [Curtobacterium sp. SGAir0471]|uniref:hypothetical protein n=1 Tax=Curtobacterium sp. SGAir0471 TaxID=2070337 RepID=UPI0010CD0F01|nr:hypothetical protein [Curtobacterium sp. SGAir0471]QCR42238.1 hypothetical protein C1N91_00505 [Curtobacterium sp. SGAir0471]
MRESDEWVVRVFVDHGATPVWYGGPRDYDEMHVSPDLERDLQVFDDWYYDAEDPLEQYAVRSNVRHDFEREGERLAQALAKELGAPFSVTVIHPGDRSGSRTYRSPVAATNPRAHAAFIAIHDEDLRT